MANEMRIEYAASVDGNKSRLQSLRQSFDRAASELQEVKDEVDLEEWADGGDEHFEKMLEPLYRQEDELTAERDHLAALLNRIDGGKR